jgi:hypothetical protein
MQRLPPSGGAACIACRRLQAMHPARYFSSSRP